MIKSLFSDGLSKSTLSLEWPEVSDAPSSLSTRTSSWRARPLPTSKFFTIQCSRSNLEITLYSAQIPFRIKYKFSTRPLATSGIKYKHPKRIDCMISFAVSLTLRRTIPASPSWWQMKLWTRSTGVTLKWITQIRTHWRWCLRVENFRTPISWSKYWFPSLSSLFSQPYFSWSSWPTGGNGGASKMSQIKRRPRWLLWWGNAALMWPMSTTTTTTAQTTTITTAEGVLQTLAVVPDFYQVLVVLHSPKSHLHISTTKKLVQVIKI